jgi:HEAT repeat protein
MRHLATLLVLAGILISSQARADVYFAFSAEQMEYQGQQRIFFVPFSFTGPTHKQMERRISVLFEKLHGSRQAIYGDTFLIVKEEGGQFAASLILDPEAVRFHDIILGETYLTLTNIGIPKVYLGNGERLLTDADVKYPYFVPTIPLWEALPPSTFPHALVRLGINEYVESMTFQERMGRKDPQLYSRILDLLKGDEQYVKLRVLEAFPHLAVPGEADYLLPLLNDKSAQVVYKAIDLLSSKTDPKVLKALAVLADSAKDPEAQLMAARILVKNSQSAYQVYILFEDLKSPDPAVVVATCQKLASSGDLRVLNALTRMLTHGQEVVREAAFAGLKQLKDLTTLQGLLVNKEIEEKYRKEAALELTRQAIPDFAKAGITYLVRNHSGAEALEAVTTLQMRGYKDQGELLAFALVHPDAEVAKAAVTAIGALELFDRLSDLSAASKRAELTAGVREVVSALLAKQPLKSVMGLAKSEDILVRELSVLSLVALAKAAKQPKDAEPILELLGESMKDKEVVIKRAAVQALNDIGGPANWKRLLKAKADTDPQVRMLVLKAALTLADADGDATILELLADEVDEVRILAIQEVRERKIKSARPKLKFLVEARNPAQKSEAMRAVVALSETEDEHKEYFEVYKKAIFDMDTEVQLAAILGLQWIIDPMVVPLLQSGTLLMHKDARVRAATLIALGRSRDYNVIENIARGFADGERSVQEAAIEGLRLMGSKKAIPPLQEYIRQTDDEELKMLAQGAIQDLETGPKGLLQE